LGEHVVNEACNPLGRGLTAVGRGLFAPGICRRGRSLVFGRAREDGLEERRQQFGEEGGVAHTGFFRLQQVLQAVAGQMPVAHQILHDGRELPLLQPVGGGGLALLSQEADTTVQLQRIVQCAGVFGGYG